ncbi:MAG: hypothetical protein QF786_13395 [Vicinamibacterales bacterium]|nr:hypothetical protein [Vicinamibacterales bacterium]MDP7692570.1 hypothetical protein [Vicinamibacterales bacterium]HJN44875.1 hypothetical protein [Vicinamibacterales bacterium]
MNARLIALLVSTGLVLGSAQVSAQQDSDEEGPYLDVSGFYSFTGYSQNRFFLGKVKDSPTVSGLSDRDNYAVQIFRLNTEFARDENLKAVLRTDLAQSIWGLDNNPRDAELRGGFSNLFNRKDTNFAVHLDWAYVDYTNPEWDANFRLGRMKYVLGSMLVLDQDSDGFQIAKTWGPDQLTFSWAKMSEGADSLSDQDAIGPGGLSTEDATLYLANYVHGEDNWTVNPFFAYYRDDGADGGKAYVPNGLQYFRARFAPQLSEVAAFGVAADGTSGTWTFRGEVDYLTGSDDIANTDSGALEVADVNNGDLHGYNVFGEAKTVLGPGTLGFIFGLGSGDDDPMSGDGNINKIRTNGFFFVNEIWEDSIMPDEEGITPQGLGSPGSRGYREFENSTLFQVNYAWNINEELTYIASGTYVQATEPIFAWSDGDGSGTIDPSELGPESSDDLGSELDMRLTWNLDRGLTWVFRGGIFWPGDGAGYLINGTAAHDSAAYELRTDIRFSFGGIRIGG